MQTVYTRDGTDLYETLVQRREDNGNVQIYRISHFQGSDHARLILWADLEPAIQDKITKDIHVKFSGQ